MNSKKKLITVIAILIVFVMPIGSFLIDVPVDNNSSKPSELNVANDDVKEVKTPSKPKSSGYWVETEDVEVSYSWTSTKNEKE